jgi:hypothetical protein
LLGPLPVDRHLVRSEAGARNACRAQDPLLHHLLEGHARHALQHQRDQAVAEVGIVEHGTGRCPERRLAVLLLEITQIVARALAERRITQARGVPVQRIGGGTL